MWHMEVNSLPGLAPSVDNYLLALLLCSLVRPAIADVSITLDTGAVVVVHSH